MILHLINILILEELRTPHWRSLSGTPTQSSLSLNKELVDIKDIIQRSILDIKSQLSGNQSVEIKVTDNSKKGDSVGQTSDDSIQVMADGSN